MAKPTKEELKKDIEESLKKIEEEKATPEPEKIEEPTPSKPPEEEKIEKEPERPKKKVIKKEEVKPVVDYKERYKQSTREAQVLHEKDKKMNEAIVQASELPEPTDKEMQLIYPEWEIMDDISKRLAKKTEISDRRSSLLHKASLAGQDIEKWYKSVDEFIGNPKTLLNYPVLEGKQEEFKIYATQPTYKNADFHLIVKSFLFDNEQEAKTNKEKNRGEMFPKGSGGPPSTDNPKNIITYDELNMIRENNYKLYKEKLKQIKAKTLEVEKIE